MKGAPCKDCLDREVGCHATCQKYQEFNQENTKKKELIRSYKMIHNEHVSFIRQQQERARRSHK